MNINQAMEKISSLTKFGSRLELDRLQTLLERLDNPQNKLKYVHVAGTNGKGSVCTMVAKILEESGYKTGLYISPYVIDFRERIQINSDMVPEGDLCDLVDDTFLVVEELIEQGIVITEFEYITALAFLWFSYNNCDIVVLETGLGGRYDATNVIEESLVDVITPISMDHMDVLGDTIEKIADEKRQIIKPKSNLVYYRQEEAVNTLIEETAKKQKSRIFHADEVSLIPCKGTIKKNGFIFQGRRYLMNLVGRHQIVNAALALTAVNALRKNSFSISDEAVCLGLEKAFIPARLEYLEGDCIIVIDGAHNPSGMEALACAVKELLPDKRVICILGMLKDKDVGAALEKVKGLFDKVICTQPINPRAMSSCELVEEASKYFESTLAVSDIKEAYKKAKTYTDKDDVILVCGSLYLASQMRPVILSDVKKRQEAK